jgi:uncharacterized protein YdbL (DUF1318 family)
MTGLTRRNFVMSLVIVALAAVPLLAASKAELKERFKQRYPALLKAMDAGTLGETFEGYVEFREGGGDEGLRKLVGEENADRREYYQLVAKEQGEGATPEGVARVTAKFNFKNARSGHWLKQEGGNWVQKK